MGLESKKIVLSKYVTFDAASLLKSTVSKKVERMKIKDVLHWVDVDAIPPSSVGSISFGISLDVTQGEDHIVGLYAEQVKK